MKRVAIVCLCDFEDLFEVEIGRGPSASKGHSFRDAITRREVGVFGREDSDRRDTQLECGS